MQMDGNTAAILTGIIYLFLQNKTDATRKKLKDAEITKLYTSWL